MRWRQAADRTDKLRPAGGAKHTPTPCETLGWGRRVSGGAPHSVKGLSCCPPQNNTGVSDGVRGGNT
ncbi:hypothetical protein E2C01_074522 [Portunus trituberculatus]|uniref:Uncharacterized protein n=1 Tax=Portunus trituberculatus TaxID=210409 RepID=A0A5B7I885_PORTR|nr:hypothetical protein [Portunus trituberculatus]